MIAIKGNEQEFNQTLFMGGMCLLCLSISILRCIITETSVFLFLNWNLFLAFIPWLLSSIMRRSPLLQERKLALILLVASWLLFFPNAPYILTDLFHLKARSTIPVWFDLVLIMSFAWTGFLFGFISLWDIEKILSKFTAKQNIPIISGVLLFVSSFGIYIGRYLRWNSWDVIQEPLGLLHDIGERIVNPWDHPTTWGMTIFMGILLNMIYWSLRLIKGIK
ncbi:MAG: DUF1361 domain-containing protein [Flavobacteriales bacterium]|nr:DUF1361 domain-containing protein [Flavobacteriales bacterium]